MTLNKSELDAVLGLHCTDILKPKIAGEQQKANSNQIRFTSKRKINLSLPEFNIFQSNLDEILHLVQIF